MKTSENSLKPKPPSYLKNINPKNVEIKPITPKNNFENLLFNKNFSENTKSIFSTQKIFINTLCNTNGGFL